MPGSEAIASAPKKSNGGDQDQGGAGGAGGADGGAWINEAEVRVALLHHDDDLRLSAYEMVCASLKTTTLPSPLELKLLRLFWTMGVKSPSAEYRQSVCVSTKKLLWRIHESDRVNQRTISHAAERRAAIAKEKLRQAEDQDKDETSASATAATAATAAATAAAEAEAEAKKTLVLEEEARAALSAGQEFRRWLLELIQVWCSLANLPVLLPVFVRGIM